MLKKNKKGIITDYLGWIILGAVVLVIVIIGIIILTGKGTSAIEYIKSLFRFGK